MPVPRPHVSSGAAPANTLTSAAAGRGVADADLADAGERDPGPCSRVGHATDPPRIAATRLVAVMARATRRLRVPAPHARADERHARLHAARR